MGISDSITTEQVEDLIRKEVVGRLQHVSSSIDIQVYALTEGAKNEKLQGYQFKGTQTELLRLQHYIEDLRLYWDQNGSTLMGGDDDHT